jgi:hypothetical protein
MYCKFTKFIYTSCILSMFKRNDNNIYDSCLGFALKNHANISKFSYDRMGIKLTTLLVIGTNYTRKILIQLHTTTAMTATVYVSYRYINTLTISQSFRKWWLNKSITIPRIVLFWLNIYVITLYHWTCSTCVLVYVSEWLFFHANCEQFFSYIMARTSHILMRRWWCLLCA